MDFQIDIVSHNTRPPTFERSWISTYSFQIKTLDTTLFAIARNNRPPEACLKSNQQRVKNDILRELDKLYETILLFDKFELVRNTQRDLNHKFCEHIIFLTNLSVLGSDELLVDL